MSIYDRRFLNSYEEIDKGVLDVRLITTAAVASILRFIFMSHMLDEYFIHSWLMHA